ncbi:MAG: sulfatase [Rikenellaceae bacterium]
MKQQLIISTLSIFTALQFSSQVVAKPKHETANNKPNVLFICIDDLRNELGCYGSMALTPNMDGIAKDGTLFTNHYVAVPTSGASRAALLSGLLPTKREYLKNDACDYRFVEQKQGENPSNMIQALNRNGYYTVGIGKISHSKGGYAYNDTSDELQLPNSWDEMLINTGRWNSALDASLGYSDGSSRLTTNGQSKPYECADVEEDNDLVDGMSADLALEKLNELSKRNDRAPFCLAVGFMRPHLPFVSPKKYWDLYDRDKIDISEYGIPKGSGKKGLSSSGEINNQYLNGDEPISLDRDVSKEYAQKLRHAYYASVSYVDAQIGKIVDRLKELELEENTIIVVWGDHGWHLGDMRVWGKHTNYEPSLKSTLIIKDPRQKGGAKCSKIVSTIDIYPTLMELCYVKVDYPLDGQSMCSLLEKPNSKDWRDYAYSYWGTSCSLRVPKYRLTKYNGDKEQTFLFEFKKNEFETEDIAAKRSDIVNNLQPILDRGNSKLF